MQEPLFPLLSLVRLRIGSDGAGVTTLAAGAGCPLNCAWCINKKLLREAPARPVTAEELFELVKVDDLYFQATGGGVTFGGGEALLHTDFICRFRKAVPESWKVNAETSLAVPSGLAAAAAEAVDLFIVDCKDMDPGTYRHYTGSDGKLMKENLRMLLDLAGPDRILVRVPLIPDYNTREDQLKSAELLKKMGVTRLDLFEYVRKGE